MMNERKIKSLFLLKVDNGEIRINCVYYNKSKKIGIIEYTRSHYKHSKKKIDHSKQYTTVCSILKQHAYDLKDDPERLSTEFMQKMIGVNCI